MVKAPGTRPTSFKVMLNVVLDCRLLRVPGRGEVMIDETILVLAGMSPITIPLQDPALT